MKEVSGKICLRYLTRHWKKHPARGKEKLRQFLLACCNLSRAEREQFEFFTRLRAAPKTLTEKEREAWAKKALAQITGRGLGSLQLLMISDLFDRNRSRDDPRAAAGIAHRGREEGALL